MDAVLDAPEVELEDDGTQEGTESEEHTEPQAEGESGEQQQEAQDEPAIVEADGKFKLSDKALQTLNEIKKTDPKLAKELRAGAFDSATLRKEFPDGVREAVALKQELAEIGGLEAITSMKGELDNWKGLDADWTGNKVQFAAEMAAGNPDAFAFHAPHIMDKFAELAPEAFTYHVAKVFAADIAANDVMMPARMLESVLYGEDGKPRAGMEAIAKQWGPIASYFNRVQTLSKTPPKAAEKQAAKQDGGIEQREQALTVREFQGEREKVVASISDAEWKKNLGTRKLSSEKQTTIQELYESGLRRALNALPKHRETIDRLVSAKDRNGYRKYMDGAYRKVAPAAMSAAFRRAGVGDKPGPKAVAKPAPAKTAATQNASGFTRIGTKPNHNEVDWPSTARIPGKKSGDGKYVMKDSSKVLYQR